MGTYSNDLEALVKRLVAIDMTLEGAQYEVEDLQRDARARLETRHAPPIDTARHAAYASRKAQMAVRDATIYPLIKQARQEGRASLRAICLWLDAREVAPAKGDKWHPASVQAIEDRGDGRLVIEK